MRAAIVFKRQDRSVVEEHASMAGAAGPLTLDARQFYHERRTNSAAIDAGG
jgi:hypothetical protein